MTLSHRSRGVPMSLPKALQFPSLKSSAVASVSSTLRITPSNSSQNYGPGTTLSFDLPAGQRSQWLDTSQTYVQFTLTPTLTAGTTPTWSAHGYDAIRSIALYSSAGGAQLEFIDQYALLHDQLRKLCSDRSNVLCADTIMLGADPSRGRAPLPKNSGASVTYAFPIASIIGLLTAGEQYLPLHALSAPLRLEIVLASADAALACAGGPTAVTFNVTNPTLNVTLLTISDVASQQISSMTGNEFRFNSTVWKAFRSIHPAQQAVNSILVPAKFSSLRGLLVAQRPASAVENRAAYTVADTVRNFLSSYQVRIGSAMVPQRPVEVTGNAVAGYLELRKVFGGLTTESAPTLVTLNDWIQDAAVVPGPTATPGSFSIGLELQPFSNVKGLISGTQSTSVNIFLDLTYDPASLASVVAADITAHCEGDALFTVDRNGSMTVQF